jgi:hypothetical protein
MNRVITTPQQVIAELRAVSAQIIHPKDTYLSGMADVVEQLAGQAMSYREQAVRARAEREAVCGRLEWCNVNGGQAYVLLGVGAYELNRFLMAAGDVAVAKMEREG